MSKMVIDRDIYLVVCRNVGDELYVEETGINTSNKDEAFHILTNANRPIAVLALNPKEGWSRDVSEDFAGAWWERIKPDLDLDNPDVPEFIEEHLGAAEVESRINQLRQDAKAEEAHIRSISKPA